MKILILTCLLAGTLASANSKTKEAPFPNQTTKDFTTGTANEPTTIKEMRHAPDSIFRTTRTAGRNADPDSGMAAPVEGSVIKGMRDNAYISKHTRDKMQKANDVVELKPTDGDDFYAITPDDTTSPTAVMAKAGTSCKDAPMTGQRSDVKASDQPQNERDVALTRDVRRELMLHKELSISAHNLTLVSENCLVTIRGTVPSTDEKSNVEQIARRVSGVGEINNLIQVAR